MFRTVGKWMVITALMHLLHIVCELIYVRECIGGSFPFVKSMWTSGSTMCSTLKNVSNTGSQNFSGLIALAVPAFHDIVSVALSRQNLNKNLGSRHRDVT